MIIQWYGQSFFRIDTGGTVIAIDPFSKTPEWGITKVPRFRADIALISHEHADHNNVSALDGTPAVFRGAGEYEIRGIFINGIPSFHDDKGGRERGANTIFLIEAEDMRICHMGDIGTVKLGDEALERIGKPDILFVPVGGKFTVAAEGAWNLVRLAEPSFVIPMHYKVPGITLPLDSVERFLKEYGSKPEAKDRLSVRKKDIPADGLRVEVLRPLAFA